MSTIGGRYEVEERLGEGNAYRVRHVQLAKQFALKVIAPAFGDDAAARERFKARAQLASELSHPNLVSVVDFGEDESLGVYIVTELVESEPLGTTPLSVRRALDVLAQVADALDHLHKRGIIHGELDAEKLITINETSGTRRRRVVRLVDVGFARRAGALPHYLAPERCSDGEPTIASDIYALGVLGYRLLTRAMPFDGTAAEIVDAHVQRVPEPLSKRRGEVLDDAIETLIMRALSKLPSIRHASAAAFRYELNAVMNMLEMSPRRLTTGPAKNDRRGGAAAQLFEQSLLPQAVIASDGTIKLANRAFAMLLGEPDGTLKGRPLSEVPLQLWVPDLPRALRRVRAERTPIERRARRWSNELIVWLTPTGMGDDIHMLVQMQALERKVPQAQ